MTDVSDTPTQATVAQTVRDALLALNHAIRNASFFGVRTEMVVKVTPNGIPYVDGDTWKRV